MHADWEQLMTTYTNTDGVLVASAKCETNSGSGSGQALCSHYNLKYYPYIIYGDASSPQEYNGNRDYNSLLAFAKSNLGPAALGGPVEWTSKQPTCRADWTEFKNKYGKVFNGPDHEAEHRQTYETNMAANEAHNAQGLSWTQGENQFSDLTQEQYRVAAGLGYKAPVDMMGALPYLGEHVHDGSEVASTVNWVTAGAVTPVKDQGQCGSCWAFSTTGSTEGAWQIGTGSLVSVSEQQLVDCATATSSGCQGGSMAGAIQYEATTAMATEASYPYKAKDGTCKSSFTAAIPKGGVTGYKSVGNFLTGASKSAMQSAIQQQPISIAIEADQSAFQSYSGGILSSGCGTSLDHGVLAVGYNTAEDYWLVKNSWGASWGDAGYIKISSASDVCGVLKQPVYPQVSGSVAV